MTQSAGQILKDEYNEVGERDTGLVPKDVSEHDVMAIGGNADTKDDSKWNPAHTARRNTDGTYKYKDDVGPIRNNENRSEASYFTKNPILKDYNMESIRRYYKSK
ncbi:hypothetical protein [Sphingobacterium faecium]